MLALARITRVLQGANDTRGGTAPSSPVCQSPSAQVLRSDERQNTASPVALDVTATFARPPYFTHIVELDFCSLQHLGTVC